MKIQFLKNKNVKENRYINGLATGAPGLDGCDGIFRICHVFTKGAFAWGLGICSVFETNIMGLIFAIEKIVELSWSIFCLKLIQRYCQFF